MQYDKTRVSNALKAVKSKNTTPEISLRKALRERRILGYRIHWKKVSGSPDIAFPAKKIAIFVHGCFWHRCPYCKQKEPKTNIKFWHQKFEKTKERDKTTHNDLSNSGWNVIVIWECQIKHDISHCVDVIQSVYNARISQIR